MAKLVAHLSLLLMYIAIHSYLFICRHNLKINVLLNTKFGMRNILSLTSTEIADKQLPVVHL
ncbi:hypothetical protein BD408DRAFT_421438 [Parasitella parasitica]|nr:hypothetical protein BD408DRAFT_421438 [Parasitella parasitica]